MQFKSILYMKNWILDLSIFIKYRRYYIFTFNKWRRQKQIQLKKMKRGVLLVNLHVAY